MSTRSDRKSCPATIERRTKQQRPARTRLTHRYLVPAPHKRKSELADSGLEKDACILARFCSRISSVKTQPLTVRFQCGDAIIESTPDIEVIYTDGSSELLEVKYVDELLKPDVRQKCRRVKDQFAAMGLRYRVITERQIRRCPAALKNYRRLLGYRQETKCLPDIRWLKFGEEYLIEDLGRKLGSIDHVYRLIALGKLACDLTRPLTLKTSVRKAKPSDYSNFI